MWTFGPSFVRAPRRPLRSPLQFQGRLHPPTSGNMAAACWARNTRLSSLRRPTRRSLRPSQCLGSHRTPLHGPQLHGVPCVQRTTIRMTISAPSVDAESRRDCHAHIWLRNVRGARALTTHRLTSVRRRGRPRHWPAVGGRPHQHAGRKGPRHLIPRTRPPSPRRRG